MGGINRKSIFIIIGFLALVAVAAGVFWFSGGYKEWQATREARQQADKAAEVQARVEEAYRNDTYGGKTPQETLDMFVAALRAGDVELASKYFALDDNTLIRDIEWYEGLVKAKKENRLNEIIDLVSKAKPASNENEHFRKYYFGFEIFDNKGELVNSITLNISPISKVWKIESL